MEELEAADTRVRVSNSRASVSNTRACVSITHVVVSDTRESVSNTQVHAEPSDSEESEESSHFDWGEGAPDGKRHDDADGGEDEAEGKEVAVSPGMRCWVQGASRV